ncbi:MAG: NAD(P)-binding protein [Planctomycetota bacterium]|nr:NAD(P)-binding protein [Planctomycetota bacterium]
MALRVHNLALGLDEAEDSLSAQAARKLRLESDRITSLRVVRRGFDARPRHRRWIYTVCVTVSGDERRVLSRLRDPDVRPEAAAAEPAVRPGNGPLEAPPVVVGAGPAGLFAALLLAEQGYRPLVLDRGRPVARRDEDVAALVTGRQLDEESNLLFGEGGAGTYSDGKLYSRTHDTLACWVTTRLVEFGADAAIAVEARPHVGSDRLGAVCSAMRARVEALGGQVRFGARVDDLALAGGRVRSLTTSDGQSTPVGAVILAPGHSARDTLAMLFRRGVALEARAFQMGVRIEHPQGLIDRGQLGELACRADLTPADYRLVARGAATAGDARADVYSFCMCPGGRVLPAFHQQGTVCTNGGSHRRRDSGWANAGLVMSVDPRSLGADPLAGIALQERIERACFAAAGGDYRIPAQRVEDFLARRASDGAIETSSLTGACPCDLTSLLPEFLTRALGRALPMFEGQLPGFAGPAAVLLAPETRASGPVRIVRHSVTRASVSADNLYPAGEGAGYAGGIVSSAVDGLHAAEALIARFRPPR